MTEKRLSIKYKDKYKSGIVSNKLIKKSICYIFVLLACRCFRNFHIVGDRRLHSMRLGTLQMAVSSALIGKLYALCVSNKKTGKT